MTHSTHQADRLCLNKHRLLNQSQFKRYLSCPSAAGGLLRLACRQTFPTKTCRLTKRLCPESTIMPRLEAQSSAVIVALSKTLNGSKPTVQEVCKSAELGLTKVLQAASIPSWRHRFGNAWLHHSSWLVLHGLRNYALFMDPSFLSCRN